MSEPSLSIAMRCKPDPAGFPSSTTALALLCVLLGLGGCTSYSGGGYANPAPSAAQPPAPSVVRVRNIQDSADYTTPSCQRHNPSADGRRAFYGVKVNNCVGPDGRRAPYVVGYFSLNGFSPAEVAGVERGDRLESIKGCAVSTSGEVRAHIEETAPGSTAFVKLRKRSGQVATVPVRTASFTPRGGDAAGRAAGVNQCASVGLRAAD